MQPAVTGHPFDGFDARPFRFHAEHQAAIDRYAIQDDRAGPAVAVITAFLRPCELESIAEHFQQAFPRLAKEFGGFAVDGSGDVRLFGHRSLSVFLLGNCLTVESRNLKSQTIWKIRNAGSASKEISFVSDFSFHDPQLFGI